jgi:plastocyanin
VLEVIDGPDVWQIYTWVDGEYANEYLGPLAQASITFMAASQSSLVVDTVKSSYSYGEVIVLVGFVDGYDSSDPMKSMDVTVVIWDPSGSIVAVAQVAPASTGQFSTSVLAGAMISDPGTYTVTAKWAAQEDETSFQFVGATLSSVTVTNAQGSSTPGCEENNECFIPSVVTILPGGTVTWENTDTAAHTATSGDSGDGSTGVWDSSLIMTGGSFSVTLNDPGTYDYYCMVHPWMSGTVVVGDGGLAPEQESEEPVVVCDSGIVIDGVCQIEVSQPELNAYVGQNEYNVGDEITVNVGLINTESNEMVIIDVLDPTGNAVVTRAVTVSPGDNESIKFRISNNFLTGSYKVVASSTIDGETMTDTTFFKIKSQYNQFQISSVEVTDQQGNPSTLTKGTLGYIKVSLTSDASITTLITVNLFDADLTTLGVGSVRSNIGEGESEIILSFLIPDDAASGEAEIFVNGFTDWISNGGVPLTGEFSTTGGIS